jgi:hypothetical protein
MLTEIIIILAVLTVAMLAVSAWSYMQSRKQPVKRVRAIVLRRRTRDYSIDAPTNPFYMILNALGWGPGRSRISNKHLARLSGEATIASIVDGFITFGAESREVELLVPENVFMNVEDGTTGILVYQGEIFRHFMPDPPPDTRTQPVQPSRPAQKLNPDS